jgi:predicted RNA binding protein YcfA (HicA-like mRNA interferase family)
MASRVSGRAGLAHGCKLARKTAPVAIDCSSIVFGTYPDTLIGVKVREAIRIIEQDGWSQVRQKGSHRQFQHPAKPGTVTVAGHLSDEVPTGTLKNIMRQAGTDK